MPSGTPGTPPESRSSVDADDSLVRLTVSDDGDAGSRRPGHRARARRHDGARPHSSAGPARPAPARAGVDRQRGPAPHGTRDDNPRARRRRPGNRPYRPPDDPRRPARHRGRRQAADGRRPSSSPVSYGPTSASSTSACPTWTASRQRAARRAGRRRADRGRRHHDLRPRRVRARRLKAGARGFLLKDAGPELLIQAVHAAANGDALIAPKSPRGCCRRSPTPAPRSRGPADQAAHDREEDPGRGRRGLTNTEIADELHISLSTVKTHLGTSWPSSVRVTE